MTRRIRFGLTAAVWAVIGGASVGRATVTTTGSVYDDGYYTLRVGSGGDGTLQIDAGSELARSSGYLGFSTGVTGTAIVTGVGSKWTNSSLLYAGFSGTGILSILDGGQVSNSIGYLGYNAGSIGMATVSGTGSEWNTSGTLYVGHNGSGSLTVADGGLVTARTLYASLSDFHGNGTITVSGGAVVDEDLIFDTSHGLAKSFAFGSGGTMNLTVDGTAALGAGYKGSGSLRIAEGMAVTSTVGYLGHNAGAIGTATVTGAGSKWTNSSALYVGYDGSGSLTVEDGGLVTAQTLYASIGDLHGDGTITVAIGAVLDANLAFDSTHGLTQSLAFGSGGTLNLTIDGTGVLGIGHKGAGSLHIADGLTVTSSSGYLGFNAGATGTATVTGNGSQWINSSNLYVGRNGDGVLTIENGGQVSNTHAYLGYSAGSTGMATITGAGSKWTNSGVLYVGSSGNGSLTVDDGGLVTAQMLYASLNDLHGNGTVSVTGGAFLDADIVFDASHGATAVIAFGAGGTLNLSLDGTAELGAGYRGTGSLRIADGVAITSQNGYLGSYAGSTGTATITGAGSQWTNNSALSVGSSGTGTLSIQDGATVSNDLGIIASATGSSGTVIVTNADSKWINSSTLYVGNSGSGALSILNGGQVSSVSGYLGYSSSSAGTLTVSGVGSTWTNTGSLYVGYNGAASLTVAEGGLVTAKTLYASITDLFGNGTVTAAGGILDANVVFDSTHGPAAVIAFGTGGTLNLIPNSTSDLGVGYRGTGSLRIADGLVVTSTYGRLGYNAGATGMATVTGADSKWSNSAEFYVGSSGAGELNIEAGGQVNNTSGYVGYNASAAGTVAVAGAGSKWTNSGTLYIGDRGNGVLSIQDAGQVSNTSAYLARYAGAAGTVTVTGVNSKWTSNGTLYVGHRGEGTLNVQNGGQVSSSTVYLGYEVGSTGLVTITGTDSKWTNTSSLFVGYNGGGSLTVADGGLVSARTLYVSLSDLHGNGTVTVTGGAVLDADLAFDSTHGLTQSLTFGSGGTMDLTVNGTAALGAGYRGAGSLWIADGLSVTSSVGYLGYNAGATGTATVTGAGSKWTNSSTLYVGYNGSGSLTVEDGGLVTAQTLYASVNDLHGNGTITVMGGAVLDADMIFDSTPGQTSVISFGTGGTLNLTVNGTKVLGAGYKGTGSIHIADGRSITSTSGYLGYNAGSSGTATVTGTGSKWTNNDTLFVGSNGNGTLSIQNGGQVSNTTGYLGDAAGTTGQATISGTNSKWTNSSTLYVGNSGDGTLSIQAGGQVSNTTGYLGYSASATGSATISGTDSKWTNNGSLYVGNSGDGTLNIQAGGQISNTTGYLGYSVGATGGATISGTGSKWTNSSTLYVGNSGDGTLDIQAGGQVSNTTGYLGYSATTTGSATIGGTDAKWTNSSTLYVGYNGSGSLIIANGGEVSNGSGYLGYNAGTTGTAMVTGTGSKWINGGALYVGHHGNGSLTVADGGLVTAKVLYASSSDLNGNGTISVTGGAIVDADMIFDSTNGLTSVSSFGTGGTLNLTINGTAVLGAGYKGAGSLRIADGLTVASTSGYLGYNAGSSGMATVTGTGSKWTNSSTLYVGYNGSGSLTVEDSGLVTAQTLYASSSDLYGDGTISVTGGGIVDADMIFDSTNGLTSVSSFGTGGILNLTVNGTSVMGAGYKGAGSLRIADGLAIASTTGYLGYNAGSSGTAIVTGSGSKWTNNGALYVGRNGNGTLSIQNGGQVSNTTGYLGYAVGTTGQATISGPNSKWTNSSTLYVGNSGDGMLSIQNGGQVSNTTGYLGYAAGTTGQATISGTNSKWTNSGALYVGNNGNGDLIILNGGQVTNTSDSILALGTGTSATATVDGTGSRWASNTYLYVGHHGNGVLDIQNGGQVSNSYSGYLGYYTGSNGTVTVSGAGSKWTNGQSFFVGWIGNGSLNIENGGQVSNNSYYAYLGYNAAATGTATVTGAGSKWTISSTLYVGNSGDGTLTIANGGQVSNGSGYLGCDASSTGTATVTGTGSKWINGGALYVGHNGNGSLTVADGGLVTAKVLYASSSDLYGDGTISVTGGGIVDADMIFDSTNGLTSVSSFGTGGILNLTVNGTSVMGAGYKGAGSLRIADGLKIASTSGHLGYNAGSSGTATVTGTGSKWTNSEWFYVGARGDGTLSILDGGQVSNAYDGYIGNYAGSTGMAMVSGTGSKWTNVGALYVGRSGNGALSIQSGGQLSNTTGYLGYDVGTSGAAMVSGADSTWTNTGNLYVGYNGSGSLDVHNGAQVSVATTFLGYSAGSTGEATVIGADARWIHSEALYVGFKGNGALTVADGGLVTTRTLYSSMDDLHGNGTITVSGGGVVDTELVFDSMHGPTSVVVFGSGGTLNLTIDGVSDLGVGYNGTGSLRVAEGVAITSSSGFLGYNSGSTGTATIAGTGSRWTSSTTHYVGNYGSGTLNILDGAQVSGGAAFIGFFVSGSGTATVAGANSKWTSDGPLEVGYAGSGSLNIQDAGQVSNKIGYLGHNAGSAGTATVRGAGSMWTNSDNLYVGYSGSGSLNIQDGGQVSAKRGSFLGHAVGATGAATVAGADSRWTTNEWLYIGYSGNGTLTIRNGGEVTNAYATYLGYNAGSIGTAIVSGTNAKWTGDSSLYVGFNGSGSLTVDAGGLVTTRMLLASFNDLYGNGTITVIDGAVLDTALVFDSSHGTTQAITFGSGGTLNLNVTTEGFLGAGYRDTGSLQITEGVTVASLSGFLGYKAGSTGIATVSGEGTAWRTSNGIDVGHYGSGTLSIESGAQVVNTNDYYTTIEARVGMYLGASGTVTVSGTGSKWINSAALVVGGSGTGTLDIKDGGQVTSTYGFIGRHSGASGMVTVSGAGAMWNYGNNLYVGAGGSGTLNILDGGQVVSTRSAGFCNVLVGHDSSSKGSVTVSGAASMQINNNSLYVGYVGKGALDICDGGLVNNTHGYLGFLTGSTGTAIVSGMGSHWSSSGSLIIARSGTGTLTVQNGGHVSSTDGYLGHSSGSTGAVTVTGVQSIWDNAQNVYIGGGTNGAGGIGTLTVSDGGQVISKSGAGTVTVWSTGTLSGSGGTITANVINHGFVNPGASPGILTIDGNYTQQSTGTLRIELDGLVPGSGYDQLAITGGTSLGGTMDMISTDPSLYSLGDVFTVITANGGVSGAFDRINGIAMGMIDGFSAGSAVRYDGNAVTGRISILGDIDFDDDVDLDDLTILGTFFGQGGSWVNGDFNGSGMVDLDDLTILGTFFNIGVMAPSMSFGEALAFAGLVSAVPEPSTLAMLGLGGLFLMRRRSRKPAAAA